MAPELLHSPRVLVRESFGRLLLMTVEMDEPIVLSATAAAAWTALAECPPDGDIVSHLAARYDIDIDALRGDVQRLTTELLAAGLLIEQGVQDHF